MDRPCQKSLGAEFSELRIHKDALRIHEDPGEKKIRKNKKKKAYNEAYSFAQKLNLECIFRNTSESQRQMLQIEINYLSYAQDYSHKRFF